MKSLLKKASKKKKGRTKVFKAKKGRTKPRPKDTVFMDSKRQASMYEKF